MKLFRPNAAKKSNAVLNLKADLIGQAFGNRTDRENRQTKCVRPRQSDKYDLHRIYLGNRYRKMF